MPLVPKRFDNENDTQITPSASTGSNSSSTAAKSLDQTHEVGSPRILCAQSSLIVFRLNKSNSNIVKTIVGEKRRIINRYFDELSEVYARFHNKDFKDYQVQKVDTVPTTPTSIGSSPSMADAKARATSSSVVTQVRDVISKITDYQRFKTLTTINYSNESSQLSSIVSSMDFDRAHEYFACVGVTKKIKIYDFNVIVDYSQQNSGYSSSSAQMETNYPIFEMQHTSKLSCISWNKYFKNQIACSDYEGAVTLWDSEQGTLLKTYQEHEKRCWYHFMICFTFNSNCLQSFTV